MWQVKRACLLRRGQEGGRTRSAPGRRRNFPRGLLVGPNYKRPSASSSVKWDVAEPWREGAPKDAISKAQWWTVFHDDDLNASGDAGRPPPIKPQKFPWRG